jgi:hypothetical protein
VGPEDVADGAEVLARIAHRQLGLEPLAQQPGAAAVVVVGRLRRRHGGERRPGQLVGGVLALGGQVRDPVVAGVRAQ